MDPGWDPVFIEECQRSFLNTYRYLVGPKGFPILGRSIPYRLAVSSPLVMGAEKFSDVVSPGEARRALDATWNHFISRGAVCSGTVTQGYFASDDRLVDPYLGPASGLWSLRSLIAAFSYPDSHPFWQDEVRPLQVEKGDFDLVIEGPRWRVVGKKDTGEITVEVLHNDLDAEAPFEEFGNLDRFLNALSGQPPRPMHADAKNKRRFYSSGHPFFCF